MEFGERIARAPVLSALLVVGGPALFALVQSAPPDATDPRLAAAAGALVMMAGLALARGGRISKPAAAAGSLLGLVAASPVLLTSPELALFSTLFGAVIVRALWTVPAPEGRSSWRRTFSTAAAARSGAAVAAGAWLALGITEANYSPSVLAGSLVYLGVATVFLLAWATRFWREGGGLPLLPLTFLVLAAGTAAASFASPPRALTAWALGLVVAAPFVRGVESAAEPLWHALLEHPARLIVITFAGICVIGTLILALPASSTSDHSIGLLDAAFTSISATCVTGLTVLDTPHAFTGLGQAAIFALIQVGGLGIMTFYAVALRALGSRMSLKHELAVAEAVAVEDRARLYESLSQVLVVTFVAEIAGAIVLCAGFLLEGDPLGTAAWRGLFTAVSAFCNAGFALQSDSLVPYQTNPMILGAVASLIVAGGLSPAVVLSTPRLLRRRLVPLQARLAWSMALALLALGFLAYLTFEWSRTLGELPIGHKLANAAFQSVTLRTAGFNSVDISATRPATQVLMITFMFVGGSPGGTAGGIKTTTAALLLLAVIAALRGRSDVTVFRRRVTHAAVYKAAAVATVGLLMAVALLLALLLTQAMTPEMATFELVSAIGTVGLSTGGTARLDGVGKVIIMAGMFIGRVGPLTLFLLLAEQRDRTRLKFPDEEIDVG